MTKTERLQQLTAEKMAFKVLDKMFNAGWKEFVNEIRAKNGISNARLFKVLTSVKGIEFTQDVKSLMKKCKAQYSLLQLSKEAKGIKLKENRLQLIKEIWVDKKPSGSYNELTVYIEVNTKWFVKFTA